MEEREEPYKCEDPELELAQRSAASLPKVEDQMIPEDDSKPMRISENNEEIKKPNMTPAQIMEFEHREIIADFSTPAHLS